MADCYVLACAVMSTTYAEEGCQLDTPQLLRRACESLHLSQLALATGLLLVRVQ